MLAAVGGGIIRFNVTKRKQMPECPSDNVSIPLKVTVSFLHLPDALCNVPPKTGFFRND
jgi:hypothetical protein